MLDHIGVDVSDYENSKEFYKAARAPLGYGLIMELKQFAMILSEDPDEQSAA